MKVLVPIDDSELSERAIPEARAMADGADLQVVLASVGELPEVSAHRDEMLAQLGRRLDEVASHIEPGIGVRRRVELAGDPVRGILEIAREEQVDRIVIASHERSAFRSLIDRSVAEELSEAAESIPVHVVEP